MPLRETRGPTERYGSVVAVAGQGTALRSRLGQVPGHGCLPPDVSAAELVVVRRGSSLRVRRAGRRRPSRVTPKR